MTTTHPTCETCKNWLSAGQAETIEPLSQGDGICKKAHIDSDPNTHPYDTALVVGKSHYCAMHSDIQTN
jgi:hypothetical protein